MKLTDIKGEQAFDVIAEIIEPIAQIAIDKDFQRDINSGKPKLLLVKSIMKSHKEELMQILAAINLQSVEEYKATVNLVTLPQQILEMLNDEQVMVLFGLQSQTEKTSFGSVMETTEAVEE